MSPSAQARPVAVANPELPGELTDRMDGWSRLWGLPDLVSGIRVVFSPRIRRSLGRCYPATGEIRLNPALREGPVAELHEVLCHELAHVAVYRLHGRVRPHGKEWGGLMRLAGYESRARMRVETMSANLRAATRPKVVYLHRCPICGARRNAARPVRRWRCARCREAGLAGLLEIFRSRLSGPRRRSGRSPRG